MRHLPPLRSVHVFETAARCASIRKAAEELKLTPSAVSHQVRGLERHLGVALFHRTHRAIQLTDAGKAFLHLATGALDRVEQAARVVTDRGFADILTVQCAPTFAPSWLMPRLHRFLKRHADVDVRLHARPEIADFSRGEVDVEIRYGNADWPGLYVVPLVAERITPLMSPRLISRRRLAPADLARLPLIHSERSLVSWSAWLQSQRVSGVNVSRGLRFDRGYLSVQAAVLGYGVALESTIFAERELRDGRLVAPFLEGESGPPLSAHYLVCPVQHLEQPKVRRFHDWILAEANEAGAFPAGHASVVRRASHGASQSHWPPASAP